MSISKTTTRALVAALLAAVPGGASSHREAPLITEMPKVDGTDFYMFRSYEEGRDGFVTLVANYLPLQDAYGGPNYFTLDPDARYRINIENDGDPAEDLIFELRFTNVRAGQTVDAGGTPVAVPLRAITPQAIGVMPNEAELYTLRVIRQGEAAQLATNGRTGGFFFAKPLDNFGAKTFADYESYARQRILPIQIPGCGDGRVFVGQRKEPFAVNLGEVFDLVNVDPVGDPAAKRSSTEEKNVTSLVLEVPIDCLTEGQGDVIGGWTSAYLPEALAPPALGFARPDGKAHNTGLVQVSRLGMPLVNEVVIGLDDKDRFNGSHPADDAQFATYVTNPALPEILEILFGVGAPNNFPREDLLAAFITGIPGLNALGFGDMIRLNTALPPTPRGDQSPLGVLGGDNAGFPNGRRPGDDVVDIELRVAMGVLCHAFPGTFGCGPADAPSGTLPYTDQAYQGPEQFDDAFPYLRTPVEGSPNPYRAFTANLEGRREVPPVDSPATGTASAVVSPDGSQVIVSVVHEIGDATAAHLHLGAVDEAGPIVCALGDPASPIQMICDAGAVSGIAFGDFFQALYQGHLYVNVHSPAFPAGEVRGQLR